MPHTYLILCGFEDDDANTAPYPELDRLIMQNVLNSIATNAVNNNDTLIVRHHPAVTALLRAHFAAKPELLQIIDEGADLQKTLDAAPHKLHSAFMVGGGMQEAHDADMIRLKYPQIALMPLKDTGGAAAHVYEGLSSSDEAHPLLKEFGDAAFGFDLIHRTMLYQGLPAIKTPKP